MSQFVVAGQESYRLVSFVFLYTLLAIYIRLEGSLLEYIGM